MSVGIGFACVKHCARGFNLVMEGLEGLVRLFGRTGEQQLQMDVQLQLQLQDEMMMQFKLLFLEMMSTPTNKLATYFGDDKPTSRCIFLDNPL